MPTVTDIADAVVAEINSAADGTWNLEFTPARAVLPQFDLTELSDLRVTVVPRSVGVSADSRGYSRHDVEIDIGVQKKLGADLDTDIETLLDLVERLVTYMNRRPLTSMPKVAWVSTENDPVYAADHLSQQRVFTSVITLTYRFLRA